MCSFGGSSWWEISWGFGGSSGCPFGGSSWWVELVTINICSETDELGYREIGYRRDRSGIRRIELVG